MTLLLLGREVQGSVSGCTPRGSYDHTLFLEGFLEVFSRLLSRRLSGGFLEGLAMGFRERKGSEKDS